MARAQEISIDHRQVAMLVRALSYEQHLPARAGAVLQIAVLAKADVPASEQAGRAMTIAFQALGDTTVQGLPVRSSQVGYTTVAALAEQIERKGIDVLYLCTGLEAELPAILELTRKRQVLSIAGKEEYVSKGASLGVFVIDGGQTVFVNLEASRREGAAFASVMLRLARVLR